jgi:hypothetical protein
MAVLGAVCVFVSGRNKMIAMLSVWFVVVPVIYMYLGRSEKIIYAILLAGLMISGVLVFSDKLGVADDYYLYAETLTGAYETNMAETPLGRLEKHGLDAMQVTYSQSGFFGKGIGAAAQGIQHLGVKMGRSWQEGGLSRVLVELGVIGFAAAMLFAFALARTIHRVSIPRVREFSPIISVQISLIAYCVANFAVFIVSHQVYSDGIIVSMTAFFIGIVLSQYWRKTELA